MSTSAFDLDKFAPAPVKFKVDGRTYTVDGDPKLATVARMLRIENDLEESEEKAMAAAEEAQELLLEMVAARDASVTELSLSVRQILVIFGLIMRGPTVAAAVASALIDLRSTPQDGDPGDDRPVATREDGQDGGDGDGPLASARSSSGPRSRSDSDTDSPADLVAGSAI